MQKIRDWLYHRFLPWVTKDQYLAELAGLRGEVESLKRENRELKAYIEGVHDTLRSRARVEIKNEVVK